MMVDMEFERSEVLRFIGPFFGRDTPVSQSAVTGSSGAFATPNLALGSYDLRVKRVQAGACRQSRNRSRDN